MESEDKRPKLQYVSTENEEFKYITNCLQQSSLRQEATVILNFSREGRMIATTNVADPDIIEGPVTELLNITVDIAKKEGKDHKFHPGDIVVWGLVNAVSNHFKYLHLQEKSRKFDEFKKGNLDDLTTAEIDEFIDAKIREDNFNKMETISIHYKELTDDHALVCTNSSLLLAITNELHINCLTMETVGETSILRYPKIRSGFRLEYLRDLVENDERFRNVTLKITDEESKNIDRNPIDTRLS